MRKAFKYRLYPNRSQTEALQATLEIHRRLYNSALEERRSLYEAERRSVSYVDQAAKLKEARKLVNRCGLIAHEVLNVKGIARGRLAKSTHDAGWGRFLEILRCKAEEAGVAVIAVDPQNTTQRCSRCGMIAAEKLTLRERTFTCWRCGFVANRDLNAARNILGLGRSLRDTTWVGRPCVSREAAS